MPGHASQKSRDLAVSWICLATGGSGQGNPMEKF